MGVFAADRAADLRRRAQPGGLDLANTQQAIGIAQYDKTIQTAFREVADALAGGPHWTDQWLAQSAVAEAESVRLKLADLRYENGIASYLDVLDAQRSLFVAQLAVQVRQAQLQNQVTSTGARRRLDRSAEAMRRYRALPRRPATIAGVAFGAAVLPQLVRT